MAVWDALKVVLVALRDEQPCVLMQSPRPEADEGGEPPFKIGLAPWAVTTAEELNRQFGDDVELTVGALPYPPAPQPSPRPTATPPPCLLASQGITAELDGPAVVRSGHAPRHGLLLRNLRGRALRLADRAAGHLPGGGRRYRANPAADRHSQLHGPAGLRGSSGEMGNPGNAHARSGSPRLTPQADTDPAPHNHRLNQAIPVLRTAANTPGLTGLNVKPGTTTGPRNRQASPEDAQVTP